MHHCPETHKSLKIISMFPANMLRRDIFIMKSEAVLPLGRGNVRVCSEIWFVFQRMRLVNVCLSCVSMFDDALWKYM